MRMMKILHDYASSEEGRAIKVESKGNNIEQQKASKRMKQYLHGLIVFLETLRAV